MTTSDQGASGDLPGAPTVTVRVEGMLAYQGKRGCIDVRCRQMPRLNGVPPATCLGYHCANCDEPSGQQGHTRKVGDEWRFTCAAG